MVRLVTARSPMEAKVLAARLGAEGFVWELRGSVDGPLAMGPIDVLVDEDDLPTARELLLLDEVESSFLDEDEPEPGHRTRELVVGAVVVALLVLFAIVRMTARV